jgi:hypothetical protein
MAVMTPEGACSTTLQGLNQPTKNRRFNVTDQPYSANRMSKNYCARSLRGRSPRRESVTGCV